MKLYTIKYTIGKYTNYITGLQEHQAERKEITLTKQGAKVEVIEQTLVGGKLQGDRAVSWLEIEDKGTEVN